MNSRFSHVTCQRNKQLSDMEFSYVNSHAYSSYMRDAISSHVAQVFNSTDQHILASQSSC